MSHSASPPARCLALVWNPPAHLRWPATLTQRGTNPRRRRPPPCRPPPAPKRKDVIGIENRACIESSVGDQPCDCGVWHISASPSPSLPPQPRFELCRSPIVAANIKMVKKVQNLIWTMDSLSGVKRKLLGKGRETMIGLCSSSPSEHAPPICKHVAHIHTYEGGQRWGRGAFSNEKK